ncbi:MULTISPECIES: hypothetical protein [unclassified Bradyrhizobium]|uniref:hypothetical protein n=1 Tax=unclassified Bradyrhizobium TaxID=2631580 RepID=UPI0028E4D544|nr:MULTISPECIES: hypothetical protein [unclassified Bradyrhizobium]
MRAVLAGGMHLSEKGTSEVTSTPLVLPDDPEQRSFLIVIGRLDLGLRSEGTFLEPARGHIHDIGFCVGPDRALTHRPPRPERVPYDRQCTDRFLYLRPDESCDRLGRVEVTEWLVYDNTVRGDIDFTGIMVRITLREQAYRTFESHVGLMPWPELGDHTSWDGGILFRIPSPPFPFPMPRGNSDPWTSRKRVVGELQPITRFDVDEIEIQPLRDTQGRRVRRGEAACDGDPAWEPPLRLRA